MTLRIFFVVGAFLLGCVCAKSLGGADGGNSDASLETLVVEMVKKESRDLGETILRLVDDKSGTLHKVVRRVSEDKDLRGLMLKAVEGLNAVIRVAAAGDVDGGVLPKPPSSNIADNSTTATSKQLTEDEEGRTFKRKKMMMRMALWMKTLFLGVALPGAVGIALFAAWKGITISLLALMLAGIVGLKGLVASASKSGAPATPQHVVLSGVPTHHQHYWKRSEPSGEHTAWGDDAHHLAYQAYST